MGRAMVSGAAVVAIGILGFVGFVTGAGHIAEGHALKSENLTGLRFEALSMFPRGSRLAEAQARMSAIGFSCEDIAHPLPDISSPSLRCASNGRGYPDYPAVNVILLSRNGLVSDVDVWNVIARADSEADGIDFTAIGASATLPNQLQRPDADDDASAAQAGVETPKS